MKLIAFLLMFNISNQSDNQNEITTWIQSIINDMIEMNDLGKYSLNKIEPDKNINLFLVESVKDIQILEDTFSLLINHGKGTYCTKLTFKYVKEGDKYFLIFPEKNESKNFIDPWIQKENICD